MPSSISQLSLEQCEQVSAGHGLIWNSLEVLHLLLGLREFINFTADRAVNGCSNIEEGDYTTEWACSWISSNTP